MSLTSDQKHYIRKNIERMTVEEMCQNTDLNPKEVIKFAKKILPQKKFDRLVQNKSFAQTRSSSSLPGSVLSDQDNFNLNRFFIDNLPYFILLLFAVLIVYMNALNNEFVSDDITSIMNNPDIGSFSKYVGMSIVGWFRVFLLFISYKIGGLNPAFFRSLNIFFHIGSTFAIFTLVSLLHKKRVALIAALIFAVHPILVEAVGWISGGPYAQYSFFLLWSLVFYILSKNKPSYFYYSLAAFILAILSGMPGIMLPPILFVYEMSFGNIRKNWKKLLPFFILMAVVTVIYFGKVGQRVDILSNNYYQNSSGLMNPFQQVPIAITSYFYLIFWPDKLSLYQTEMVFSQGQYILRILEFLVFLGIVFWGWKKNKSIFFWLSFFFISLGPSLTPLKVAWIVAERYVYLGTAGVIVVMAIFINWLIEKSGEKYKPAFYVFIAAILIALSARTIIRNIDWRDEDHLWPATMKAAPSGAPIHNNMGDVYARAGNLPKAAEEFKKAAEINPDYADAFHNLGNVYQIMNNLDEALKYYQKASELNPNIWQTYENMSVVYYDQGKFDLALENIKKAARINPTEKTVQDNLKLMTEKSK